MKLQCFIFNWPGHYESARKTESQLIRHGYSPIVINSDPENTPDHWFNVGNDAWYTQQWQHAINLLADAEILFQILADVTYDNWNQLIIDALDDYKKYNWGAYAPACLENRGDRGNLHGWLGNTANIFATSNPDCACWFVAKSVINEYNNLKIVSEENRIGWGIDIIISAISWSQRRVVLKNRNHLVNHKPGRNYSDKEAHDMMIKTFQNLPPHLLNAVNIELYNPEMLVKYIQ